MGKARLIGPECFRHREYTAEGRLGMACLKPVANRSKPLAANP